MNQKPYLAIMRCCTVTVLGLGLMGNVVADDGVQKFGFIDVERLHRESKQAQAIQKVLDQEFSSRYKALQKIQHQGGELEKKLASSKLTKAEREKMVQEYSKLVQKFRLQQAKLAEEYNLRRNEEFAALQQSANHVIIDLARKEGYDLILKDVIYVSSKYDITNKVIKAMNERVRHLPKADKCVKSHETGKCVMQFDQKE